VTYRKRYAAPRGRGPKNTAAGKPLDPSKTLTSELMNTLASPLPKTGIQLRITAIAKKGVDKNSDVEVLIDTLGKDLVFTEKNGTFNDKLSLSVGVFNKQGKSVFAERPDIDLALRPESHARVTQTGVRLLRHLSLPPGRYQVRVAAQDSGKVRQGSAHFDLDVPDFTKNPIALSNLALAATADRSVYSPPKPGFDPCELFFDPGLWFPKLHAARRLIQKIPNCFLSGKIAPGRIAYTYSGDNATPTMVSERRRPLMMAATRSPGWKPCASQNTSLASTSSGLSGSTHRPLRR